jgi:hypothetical protein
MWPVDVWKNEAQENSAGGFECMNDTALDIERRVAYAAIQRIASPQASFLFFSVHKMCVNRNRSGEEQPVFLAKKRLSRTL